MNRSRFALVFAFALGLGVLRSSADPVLYYSPTGSPLNAGLGSTSSTFFTQAVVSAFGAANVKSIANFSNASGYSDADVLFINLRQDSEALQGQEKTNIINFINAGGAVFFVGEHNQWATWDNSFLGIYGDSVVPWGSVVQAAVKTANTPSMFNGGSQINVSNPGGIAGGAGLPIFVSGALNPMSSLFGPSNNAIAFLDTTALSDSNSGQSWFYTSLASWLFTTGSAYQASQGNAATVPDSDISVVFIGTLLALGAVHRLRRR